MVRTLGVDLASDPKNTGLCVVEWQHGCAFVQRLVVRADDGEILSAARECSAVGIDAPFGWPIAFRRFIGEKPGDLARAAWTPERRIHLQYRETDRYVQSQIKQRPLSVSSDRIAVVAMRCAGLLTQLKVQDRSGEHSVFEVYPAAALKRWGFDSKGYKGPDKEVASRIFQNLVDDLLGRAGWLRCVEWQDLLTSNTDAFDALICALVARAADLKLTDLPSEEQAALAGTEGWIHVPREDSLDILAR